MNAIEVTDFTKNYGRVEAVRGVSLTVRPREMFGLIGPDGAGKTTLMRAICTLLAPSRGSILVQGLDVTRNVAEIRNRLGYMPQRFSLYQDLTVEQNLRFFADIFGVPEAERQRRMRRLYDFSRLEPFKHRKAGALSGGMKQKLALSCALIHTPEVLVLDEPTFGVDPVSRQEFWDILRQLQQEGSTILVSTAYMDEADQCDRVALFFRGRIVGMDAPETLKRDYRRPLYALHGTELYKLREFFHRLPQMCTTQLFGDALHVSFSQEPAPGDWQAWQQASAGLLQSWRRIAPSIEDIFLDHMGAPDEQ